MLRRASLEELNNQFACDALARISEQTLTAIRFGYGLGGGRQDATRQRAYDSLRQPDHMVRQHPGSTVEDVHAIWDAYAHYQGVRKTDPNAAAPFLANIKKDIVGAFDECLSNGLSRIADTDHPFRERLTWFWTDHFAAAPRNFQTRLGAPIFVDDAIRPHITGSFSDLLFAAVTHPFMMVFLDQVSSIGPNSAYGQKRKRGLNENLAREVLELHTLGVGGGYTQSDVRQLAELFTGLSYTREDRFQFRTDWAEPGPEIILGKQYGIWQGRLEDIRAVLQDLSTHPDTARHIAGKLARHFTSDTPDPAYAAHIEAAWAASGGQLMAVYQAMLEHPYVAESFGQKARQPFDYAATVIRAMGIGGSVIQGWDEPTLRKHVKRPLRDMGQPWMEPGGPDGWPEEASAWINPNGLALRLIWSRRIVAANRSAAADPAGFLKANLADIASERLFWAVSVSQSREEALALILASPEFNRR